MQCQNCRFILPPNAPVCLHCGAPTPYNVQPMYGPPPQPGPMYGPPAPGPAVFVNPPSPQKGPNAALIVLIVLGVLILLGSCISCAVFAVPYFFLHQATTNLQHTSDDFYATSTAIASTYSTDDDTPTPTTDYSTPAPTPYSESDPPSGQPVNPNFAVVFARLQLASQVNGYAPANNTSQFEVGQTVYATFIIKSGYVGYLFTKWYFNGGDPKSSKSLQITQYGYQGYFYDDFTGSGYGAVEFYWCNHSSCDDATLAAIRTFSVS